MLCLRHTLQRNSWPKAKYGPQNLTVHQGVIYSFGPFFGRSGFGIGCWAFATSWSLFNFCFGRSCLCSCFHSWFWSCFHNGLNHPQQTPQILSTQTLICNKPHLFNQIVWHNLVFEHCSQTYFEVSTWHAFPSRVLPQPLKSTDFTWGPIKVYELASGPTIWGCGTFLAWSNKDRSSCCFLNLIAAWQVGRTTGWKNSELSFSKYFGKPKWSINRSMHLWFFLNVQSTPLPSTNRTDTHEFKHGKSIDV